MLLVDPKEIVQLDCKECGEISSTHRMRTDNGKGDVNLGSKVKSSSLQSYMLVSSSLDGFSTLYNRYFGNLSAKVEWWPAY